MKKSQMLLAGLVLFGLVTMTAVNLLLKAEYVNGNIRANGEDDQVKIKRFHLKPFHHIVYDGTIKYTGANGDSITIKTPRRIFLHTRKDTSAYLDLSTQGLKFVKLRQSGDTLYIHHSLAEQRDDNLHDDWINMLYTPDSIASITSVCGTVNVSLFQESPLRIAAMDNSVVQVEGAHLPALDLQLSDHTVGYIRNGGYIGAFAYSLTNGSYLEMQASAKIGQVKTVDSLSMRDTTIAIVPVENEAIIHRHKRDNNISNF